MTEPAKSDLRDMMIEKRKTHQFGGLDYADLLRSAGLEIKREENFGSYQGDLVFLVSDGERTGLLIQGYGSCSGCDALESAHPWDDDGDFTDLAALRDQMVGEVQWPGPDGLLAALEARIADPDRDDWWRYADDAALECARTLAREAVAA